VCIGLQTFVQTTPETDSRGQARGFPPVGLVLEQGEVGGLVVVDPDDPGHGGVVKDAGPARAGLQQLELVAGDGDAGCR